MPNVAANGITIEYDTFGDPVEAPVLLIMGLGAQMTAWDDEFCAAIAARGFHVIRFDNRDVGLSTWFHDASEPAYSLSDMANDAAGLLDVLGIDSAHIVGASMGGMIAQTFALEHPERTRTLTSIMSTTGDRSVGQASPEALSALLSAPPTTRDEAIDARIRTSQVIGSPGYTFDEDRLRQRAAASYDRAFNPPGMARQLAAIMAQPDRTDRLGEVTVPTLVIHGADDPLVHVSGGHATAAAVPGAELVILPGMGHDLPPDLTGDMVDAMVALFARG